MDSEKVKYSTKEEHSAFAVPVWFFIICCIVFVYYVARHGTKDIKKFFTEKIVNQEDISYTVKIIDEKGEPKLLYKDKTLKVNDGVLYVCPVGTINCANDSKAIMLHGNFIVERQD